MTTAPLTKKVKADIKRSLKWAKTHVYTPLEEPEKDNPIARRMTPEARFGFLMNIALELVSKPHKNYPKRGNIYLVDHTELREYSAPFTTKLMSVATMFVYFRNCECLLDCLLVWANANADIEDEVAQALAVRILTQYAAVYGVPPAK